MPTVRTFVAFPLDASLLSSIKSIQQTLRAFPADVKWVRSESIHLTLKFLGNVDEESLNDIAQAVERAAQGRSPWTVRVRKLGCFPSMRNPRVVWVGLDDPDNRIVSLQQSIEDNLAPLGFKKEKRTFTPHLTIGRIRSGRGNQDLIRCLVDEREREIGDLSLQKVVLYKSDLKPSGAVYTPLREFEMVPVHD